jgi:hypothetical protein
VIRYLFSFKASRLQVVSYACATGPRARLPVELNIAFFIMGALLLMKNNYTRSLHN